MTSTGKNISNKELEIAEKLFVWDRYNQCCKSIARI